MVVYKLNYDIWVPTYNNRYIILLPITLIQVVSPYVWFATFNLPPNINDLIETFLWCNLNTKK